MSAAISLLEIAPLMTAEQFASWPGDGTGRQFQLIDGEPVAMAPASQMHGLLQMELGGLVRDHLKQIGSPCRVIGAPGVQPRAGAATNVRVPDLAVTCSPLTGHYMANPVVIIEILSPSNQHETYEAVRAYLGLPSLREIIVVSSVRVAAEMLARQADGSWPADPRTIGADGELRIDTFGFGCPLRNLYPA